MLLRNAPSLIDYRPVEEYFRLNDHFLLISTGGQLRFTWINLPTAINLNPPILIQLWFLFALTNSRYLVFGLDDF